MGDAIREYFARQSELSWRELRLLLRRGWITLIIDLSFLAVALTDSAPVTQLIEIKFIAMVRYL